MKCIRFFSNHKKTLVILVGLFLYSATIVFAVPPGSPYAPGATLDPNCGPTDTNCSVTAASAVWSSITGNITDQTDLQTALNAKFDIPSGNTSQVVLGDGSLGSLIWTTNGGDPYYADGVGGFVTTNSSTGNNILSVDTSGYFSLKGANDFGNGQQANETLSISNVGTFLQYGLYNNGSGNVLQLPKFGSQSDGQFYINGVQDFGSGTQAPNTLLVTSTGAFSQYGIFNDGSGNATNLPKIQSSSDGEFTLHALRNFGNGYQSGITFLINGDGDLTQYGVFDNGIGNVTTFTKLNSAADGGFSLNGKHDFGNGYSTDNTLTITANGELSLYGSHDDGGGSTAVVTSLDITNEGAATFRSTRADTSLSHPRFSIASGADIANASFDNVHLCLNGTCIDNWSDISGGGTWGSITGTLSDQTDLQAALDTKYDTSNPSGFITDISGFTTDNLTEGSTNLYYTDARFDTRFSAKTTGDLTEGSNLYYTDARARAALSVSGSPLTYDNSTGVFGIDQATGSTAGYLSATDWSTFNNKGSGSVTSVSVTSANGFGGSVATATTTPAITLTTNVTGLLKGNGTGVSAAVAGTDYESPLTFSTGLTRATNTITVNTSQNIAKLSNLTTNGFVKTSGSDGTLSVDTNTYLTGNQSTTLSGAVTGSGTTAITTTLASGIVGVSNLSATGTPSATTYLRGDNTWGTPAGGGTVTSVSGTTNRITSTGGNTPVIDISSSYVGQTSLTTLGTITTGTWNGSLLTGTYGGTGINNGSNTITIAGNLVTTGAFNTTFAASATGTYTLPSATSTLLANNLGISGGSTIVGDTASGGNLTLTSTSNGTKGKIIFGSASAYDQVNDRFGITQTTPTSKLHINTNSIGTTNSDAYGILLQNTTAAAAGAQQQSPGIVFDSYGWKTTATAASQEMKWRITSQPQQSTTNPLNWLVFETSVNNAAYQTPIIFEGGTGTIFANQFEGGFRTLVGGTGNFNAATASTVSSIAISLAGSTNSSYRTSVVGTTTATITATNSYAALSVLGSTATIAASGTHPLFASVAIKPLTINSGAGTLTNSATLYVQDAATGATNNYAIWSAAGSNKFDGTTTLADTVISDSTPTLSNAGFATCSALTTVSNVITCTASDRTLKTNFHDYNDGLTFIRNIQPQTYTFKEGTQYFDNNRERLGFIAQEVQAAGLTDAVLPIGNGLIQVDFNAVTAAAISAIKSLDIQVQALPVFTDQSFATKIADFLRNIAENGLAIVDKLKTHTVQTQELCIGDDTDQVCVTKDQLRTMLQTQQTGPTTITTTAPAVETPPTVDTVTSSEPVVIDTPPPTLEESVTPTPDPVSDPAPTTSAQ